MSICRILFLLLCILFAVSGWTQGPQTEPETLPGADFHESMEVDLVNLTLTAIDTKGRFVTDLKAGELAVMENGVAQEIRDFTNFISDDAQIPLTVAFLIDNSTSMNESVKGVSKFDVAKDAASLVLKELRSDDKMILMTFNKNSFQASELTSDKKQLELALQSLKVQIGRTALFDSIYAALGTIKDEWGRKIMIICSDGQDNASNHQLDEIMMENLNAAEVTVLAVGIVAFEPVYTWPGQIEEQRRAKEKMQQLADGTGGFAYFPNNLEDAKNVNQKLKDIVRSQYSIAYKSTNPAVDGSWRKIVIACTRPKVKLVYRTGYYAKK